MLSRLWKAAGDFASQQPLRNWSVLQLQDSLLKFLPGDTDWDTELDAGMHGGWIVLNSDFDWSTDAFAEQNWSELEDIVG